MEWAEYSSSNICWFVSFDAECLFVYFHAVLCQSSSFSSFVIIIVIISRSRNSRQQLILLSSSFWSYTNKFFVWLTSNRIAVKKSMPNHWCVSVRDFQGKIQNESFRMHLKWIGTFQSILKLLYCAARQNSSFRLWLDPVI